MGDPLAEWARAAPAFLLSVPNTSTRAAFRRSDEVYTPGFDGPLNSPETSWCGGRGGGPATAGAFQCPHPSAI